MIVLGTKVSDGKYYFTTQNSGKDTVKSPAGMFPSYAIDNDLKYVDEKIRNYYEIGEFLSDEEMKEIDEIAKKDDIPIDDGKKKRGRRSEKKEESENPPVEEKKKDESNENVGSTSADSSSDAENKTSSRRNRKTTVGESDNAEVSKSRVRTRKSREEVQEDNAEKVANAGIPEGDDREEVPFEETETPELEKVPRRTRRGRR